MTRCKTVRTVCELRFYIFALCGEGMAAESEVCMRRRIIVLLFVMAAVFFCFCCGAFAAERDSVSVSGNASAEVSPDMAILYGNLEKRAAVAETARENLAKEMAAFKRVLLGQMIAGQDIQTVHYMLQPEYSYEKNKRRLTGYVARADYKVKIKSLEKLGPVIDRSIGCNFTVDRVEFGLNNRSLFENRLLEEAVSNARSKAAVVARAGGRTLGNLVHASFHTASNATRSLNRNMMMAKAASLDAAESASTELDPGIMTVDVNVNLEFALE